MSREDSIDQVRIETRLTFDTHRLEKGLSHTHFRFGFGKAVLAELAKRLELLKRTDSQYTENPKYIQALAAIGEYRRRHESAGYDLSAVQSLFPTDVWESSLKVDSACAGSIIIRRESKKNNITLPFEQLAERRHAVREYDGTPVAQDLLNHAYRIAMTTPSVCNRQATRIHQIDDPQLVADALRIQGGFNGYDMPPVLLLVTSDIRAFMNGNERNEPFTDGGLFAMNLLLALEACGLAACPLNVMFSFLQGEQTRSLLNLPDNEFLIMYIAVGNFLEQVPVCRSTRLNPQDILTRH